MTAVPSPSFPELARPLSARLEPLHSHQVAAMDGFARLARGAMEEGQVSAKTKELIALALAIAGRSDGCIATHARALVRLGATRAEIEETVVVAVYMGGGASLMHGTGALTAYAQFGGDLE